MGVCVNVRDFSKSVKKGRFLTLPYLSLLMCVFSLI